MHELRFEVSLHELRCRGLLFELRCGSSHHELHGTSTLLQSYTATHATSSMRSSTRIFARPLTRWRKTGARASVSCYRLLGRIEADNATYRSGQCHRHSRVAKVDLQAAVATAALKHLSGAHRYHLLAPGRLARREHVQPRALLLKRTLCATAARAPHQAFAPIPFPPASLRVAESLCSGACRPVSR